MIKYAIGCENAHEFEGWFSTGDEFDRLKGADHLSCPVCGSTAVEKLLMAPSVKSTKGREERSPVQVEGAAPNPPANPEVPQGASAEPMPMAALPPKVRGEIIGQLRALKKQIMAGAENVGGRFPEEARKIHYGEAEKRGIYGNATLEEAVELWDEGVEVMPLPDLPEEHN